MRLPKDTETLDRVYLEWSQFTRARTAREIKLLAALKMLREIDDAYGFDLNEQQRDQMHDAIAHSILAEERGAK